MFDQKMYNRREILQKSGLAVSTLIAGGALSGCFRIPEFAGGGAGTGYPNNGKRAITLKHSQSGEEVSVVYKDGKNYYRDALRQIDYLMRDRHQNAVYQTDPRLIDLLYDLHYASHSQDPILLLSGYRSPETNAMLRRRNRRAAKNSLHMKGMAADIRIPNIHARDLRQVALNMKRGGVGYYGSRYIHVDVGDVRSW